MSETEPPHAVLFPWFIQAVGLIVFYILSRNVKALPYTAVLFVIGIIMGIGASRNQFADQLSESTMMWSSINSEVLLLVFIPGLVFKDALNVNFHLFSVGLVQILLFAFPMVLAGTVLTACIAFYIFPYNWPWSLCMTFGSILSATDPVAVAALLGKVGAPPRLLMHVLGESMFNDGSAVVFFSIFSGIYLSEISVDGLGMNVNTAEGFKIFFQLSIGGILIGASFGLALISILFVLDRRLENENNVVQVAATVTTAYLTFYTAEVVCGTSGILAVVLCGVTTRAFGGALISNQQMMDDFWGLLEHLLNSLVFALGGVVFGTVISHYDTTENFIASDWGYLFLLYALLIVIRFLIFGAFYPVISKIGLGTNWQETVFVSFSGLRGAVGIALALAIDNTVRSATEDEEKREPTTKLLGMVSGVAFLTSVINGTSAGPLLDTLGLTKSSEAHKKIMQHYDRLLKMDMLNKYASLKIDDRFSSCSFELVRHHVDYLQDVTDEEAEMAIDHVKRKKFDQGTGERDQECGTKESIFDRPSLDKTSTFGETELRLLFIELLRAAYQQAIEEGYLDPRVDNGFVYFSLNQSLDFAIDAVNRGAPIEDWKYTKFSQSTDAKSVVDKVTHIARNIREGLFGSDTLREHHHEYELKRMDALRAFAFQEAHRFAREKFQSEFGDAPDSVAEAVQDVLKESQKQEDQATAVLDSIGKQELEVLISHFVCIILLSKAVKFIKKHHGSGLIGETDAHSYLDKIDEAVSKTHRCVMSHKKDVVDEEHA